MTVTPRHSKDVEVPLRSRPPLETLREACPGEWLRSQDDLARLLTDGGSDALRTFLASADPEIAAGDGTLSRFLTDAGVAIAATDDFSWDHAVRCGEDVQRLDARKSLRLHAPTVVVCSRPPLGNTSNIREEPSLSRLIPPGDVDGAVHLFRRQATSLPATAPGSGCTAA